MFKKKSILMIIIIVLMVGFMSVNVGAESQVNYWEESEKIFVETTKDMGVFTSNIEKASNGEMDGEELLDELEESKYKARKNLEKMISISENAKEKDLNVEMVSVLSGWYTVIEMVEKGLINGDDSMLSSSLKVMELMTEKAEKLSMEIEDRI